MNLCKRSSVAVVAVATAITFSAANANEEVLKLSQDPANWAMPTGDYANTRYSKLDHITPDNAGDLKPVWTFSTGVLRGHEGGPLVVGDGNMYIHSPFPNRVYSLDLSEDGRINWMYEPKQDPAVIPIMCCDTVNRGLSYGDGKIFLYQADATLVALDKDSGEVVWSVSNGDPSIGESGTSAPMVFNDKVIVGISGGEFGVHGHITAYNISDGSLAWRGYSTGPDDLTLMDGEKTTHLGEPVGKDSGTATWEGDQWKIGGGWNPVQRPGDNRWSMTIFARDVDTGMAKWVYQMTPHDEWDYDGINEMILADIEIDGEMRKTLVHFDRNGFGYTLDRVTGELLVAEKFDPAVNWATHVDMKTGRPQVVAEYSTHQNGEDVNSTNICPAALGSKDQQPAAFSPDTNLFYVPTNHVCMDYEPFEVAYTAGQPYVGATLSMFPAGKVTEDGTDNLGNFIAWDASKGEIKWSNPEPFSVWSGALATAGNVVFYGTLEGYLKAVNAETGEELYKFKTPSSIIGNVNTWEHDGKQYVGVLSGLGGWAGIGFAAGLTGKTVLRGMTGVTVVTKPPSGGLVVDIVS